MNEEKGLGIQATNDYPWFRLERGQVIPISLKNGLICSGTLGWEPAQLEDEIKRGLWNLVVVGKLIA